MVRVLFVCLGNICRSPTAEGVFRHMTGQQDLKSRIHIDSAGTHAYHVGEPPDPRAQQAAARRGIDLSALRGRKAMPQDLDEFDYVLAMDEQNQRDLLSISSAGNEHKIGLLMSYAATRQEVAVPDPYFGGGVGFELVLDMIEEACDGLLDDIRQNYLND
ncbi:MAG: low molecular weight phosphotyrosine protein phosphatase [Gammaproteobacteria bacterium]|nr:low molecular weight phosphotyrosine protein phosphatase [Gammaproteobacteria bacterium]